MTYTRVIPRDLFNEASLLKCLGQLWIKTERYQPIVLVHHSSGAFRIGQNEDDGSISCHNVHLRIGDRAFDHRRPLNSREPWPLWVWPVDDPDAEEVAVFDDSGELSGDFLTFIAEAKGEDR